MGSIASTPEDNALPFIHSDRPAADDERSDARPIGSDGHRQVLLLQPWVEDFYATDCRVQPIGLAYLSGSLKHHFPGLDVQIFDTLAGGEKRTIPWPGEFQYLKPYYGYPDQGPFSLFHQYYRFGQSEAAILRRLATFRPFLIGISCLFTPYYRQSLALARLCRQVFPGVPIVMGGNHATLHPQMLLCPKRPFGLDENLCDFVLRGECEQSICELVEYVLGARGLADVQNLVTRNDVAGSESAAGAVLRGRAVDSGCDAKRPLPIPPRSRFLAHPDFTGLDADQYRYDNRRMTFLITSRSCPHRCTFCSIHAVFGYHYENRRVEDVIEEIRGRCAEGILHFDIEDDNFTFDKAHTHELLERVIAERLPVTFSAMNGLSYLSLDGDLLRKMKRAGFDSLNLALVSSDSLVRRFTQRPHTLEKFREVLELAAALEFRVTAYCILGMPGQSVEEMWATLQVLAAGRCLVGASPFYFTPGSPIHLREKDNPAIRLASQGRDPYFSARLSTLDLECDDFSRDDVYTLFRLTRVINYVKAGLDLGYGPDDPYFRPAAAVFTSGTWYAESKRGTVPLPFSPMVRMLLGQDPLQVCGYKTHRRLTWFPDRRQWDSAADGAEKPYGSQESENGHQAKTWEGDHG